MKPGEPCLASESSVAAVLAWPAVYPVQWWYPGSGCTGHGADPSGPPWYGSGSVVFPVFKAFPGFLSGVVQWCQLSVFFLDL